MKLPILAVVMATMLTGCVSTMSSQKPNNKQTSELKTQIALEYLKAGNIDASKVALDEALQKDPSNASANMSMGITLQLVGTDQSMKEADKYFLRAVQLDPKDAQIRNNYGQFLFKQGKYREAIKQFEVSANTIGYNNRDGSLNNLGQAYYILANQITGDTEEQAEESDALLGKAKQAFLASLQVNPKNASSLYHFSEIAYSVGEIDQATSAFKDYANLIGKQNLDAKALWLGVRINHINNNRIAMREYAEELRIKYPKSQQYKRYLTEKDNASVWSI